uniref:Uncharacterized protein n=1 Tax=Daphnia galeata TaxID=27404 RepID=A0A8J2RF97_9CRUS|nr:unnamed protein product [Daphnia galeata]
MDYSEEFSHISKCSPPELSEHLASKGFDNSTCCKLTVGLLAAALVISWRFDLCQVKPMCFYARKSPIQFVQSSPVKSSQVKPMCFYARKSASEITAIDNNWIAGSSPGYILEV